MKTPPTHPLHVVQAWHEALNRRDPERVLELSDPNIEIVGPRGSGYGHDLLRDWLNHARVNLIPTRTLSRGEAVVAQHGIWHFVETGEVTGEAEVGSYFIVRYERVARYARYENLDSALQNAGLTYADEVR